MPCCICLETSLGFKAPYINDFGVMYRDQEDCHDFLTALLGSLAEEFRVQRSKENAEMLSVDCTPINFLFGMYLRTVGQSTSQTCLHFLYD